MAARAKSQSKGDLATTATRVQTGFAGFLETHADAVRVGAVLLLILFSLSFTLTKSLWADEHSDITAGYSKLLTGDFRFAFIHAQGNVIYGIPLLLMRPQFPLDNTCWTELYAKEGMPGWTHTYSAMECEYQFLFVMNPGKERQMLIAARLMALLMGVILLLVAAGWVARAYGKAQAALFSLLFVTSPVVLMRTSTANVDIVMVLLLVLSMSQYWAYTQDKQFRHMRWSGFWCGLAIAAKISPLLIFFPVMLLYPLLARMFRLRVRNPWKVALVFLLFCWLGLNMGYLFQGTFVPVGTSLAKDPIIWDKVATVARMESLPGASFLLSIPSPVPYYFAKTLGFVANDILYGGGLPTYAFGRVWPGPVPWYLSVLFLLKSPLPLLVLLAAGLWVARRRLRDHASALIILVFFAGFLLQLKNNLQISVRYVLLAFPLAMMLASRSVEVCGDAMKEGERKGAGSSRPIRSAKASASGSVRRLDFLVLFCVIWSLASAFFIMPHFEAYYNELAGGPWNGLDLFAYSPFYGGANVYNVQRYVEQNNITRYGFHEDAGLYPTAIGPGDTGVPCVRTPGTYFVGANALRPMDTQCYRWLRSESPTAVLWWTIYRYDIS
ncbi:hypothetical protein AUJ68_00410 [Candidatus Woesearchaeota archaeon CG1_02_57_44]|nr:MAG: hypothetical protein AUJ68_00410 [Candidatus Woesearchaeota archaeon CG1_02_57_44]